MIVVCIKGYNVKVIKNIMYSSYGGAHFLDKTQIKKVKKIAFQTKFNVLLRLTA